MAERLGLMEAVASGFAAVVIGVAGACAGGDNGPKILAEHDPNLGGQWVTPKNGETITGPYEICVKALVPEGKSPVASVQITAHWPGDKSPHPKHPDAWSILETVKQPNPKGWHCTVADFGKLGAPPGEIELSFDVDNDRHERKLAPSGGRKITFTP